MHYPFRTPAVSQCVRTCYCQFSTPSLRLDLWPRCTLFNSPSCIQAPFMYVHPHTLLQPLYTLQSSPFSFLSTYYCWAILSSQCFCEKSKKTKMRNNFDRSSVYCPDNVARQQMRKVARRSNRGTSIYLLLLLSYN